MSEAGLISQRSERRDYEPGPLAFRLGNLYRQSVGGTELVDAALSKLIDEFGLTGYAGVLKGTDVVLIRVRQGSYPIRLVLGEGTSIPAHGQWRNACSYRTEPKGEEIMTAIAIGGGRLIDGTGSDAIADSVVVIEDGRITQAGKSADVHIPRGAKHIEADGATVLPGLFDVHVLIAGIVSIAGGPVFRRRWGSDGARRHCPAAV